MKIFLAHASTIDFKTTLYAPIRASALNAEHEFTLPHEQGQVWNTKEAIQGADLFLADVSEPSTGCGIEIGWADAAGVPIVVLHAKGTTPSAVVPYVAKTILEYASSADLIEKLSVVVRAS